MNVVHLSTNLKKGGAAVACQRLHHAMLDAGINSTVLTAELVHRKGWKNIIVHNILANLISGSQRWDSERLSGEFGVWSSGYGFFSEHDQPELKNADIIYLHWINGAFLSIPEISRILSLGKPVYWILHDMWPLTGGCHHSFECQKYQTHCGNCYQLKKSSSHDQSFRVFQKKRKLFSSHKNLHLITPSQWLGNCAKQSALFSENTVSVIPNPVGSSTFFPIQKSIARNLLGLPEEKKILLFGADNGFANPYKGWNFLQTALKNIDMSDKLLLIFGSDPNEQIARNVSGEVRFLGTIQPDWAMNLVYNSADILIVPSLADNFPSVIAESMLTGTPCAAFDVGGIPDLVLHKENGYLVRYKDSEDLACGIQWLLNDADPAERSANAIKHIRWLCDPQRILQMHRQLWDNP